MKKYLLLFTGCILAACTSITTPNKFADPVLVKIADLQDHRYSDSLYTFFKHENPSYRKDAAIAFASIQDSLAVDELSKLLLNDASAEVRKAAAIALGQTPSRTSAAALRKALMQEKDQNVLVEVIEACGKTFDKKDIAQIDVSSTDTLIQQGMAWACYRLGLRNLADSTLTLLAINFLDSTQTLSARLGAANFFARGAKSVQLAEKKLINAAQHDPSPWVRAGTTSALRKIKTPAVRETITKILKTDADYRVRISAVRALQKYPLAETKIAFYEALNDRNINVAIAGSEVILNMATAQEAKELAQLATKTANARVRGNLYQASLSGLDNEELVKQIITVYKTESNPYAKAALLTALGKSKYSWKFLDEELQQATVPVIRSAAATALVSVNTNASFDKTLTKQFAQVYVNAINTGDAAAIGIASDALQNPKLGYKEVLTDYNFLYEARKKLSLPKDNEALQPLEAAIAYFEGKQTSEPVTNEFNHPINWELVKTIPKDQKVSIKTDKGEIVLRLLVEEAPGSVANFVQLINDKYFDAKNFHRVVPNFVIQGGCNRGDGWGSEDYSIRSELTHQHYTEGSVGMASAGKDTEGTQWFITHSPTPHLDGRYSIFAITESGMDVVHQIEVGDKIVRVTLLK